MDADGKMGSSSRPVAGQAADSQRSDFDDPAIRQKYQALAERSQIVHEALAEETEGLELTRPDLAEIGQVVHGLVFGTTWPRPGDKRVDAFGSWEGERYGQATHWKRVG